MTRLSARIWAGLALVAIAASGCSGSSTTNRSVSAPLATSPPPSRTSVVASPQPTASRATSRHPAPTTRARTPAPPPRTTRPPAPVAVTPRSGRALPLAFSTGSATKVITVVASSTRSTTATLQAWNRAPGGGWLPSGGAVYAHVGSAGLTTTPSEGMSATPIGKLRVDAGLRPGRHPGTRLPYFVAGPRSVGQRRVVALLQHPPDLLDRMPVRYRGGGEPLSGRVRVRRAAVVIDDNRFPAQAGAGMCVLPPPHRRGPTPASSRFPRRRSSRSCRGSIRRPTHASLSVSADRRRRCLGVAGSRSSWK